MPINLSYPQLKLLCHLLEREVEECRIQLDYLKQSGEFAQEEKLWIKEFMTARLNDAQRLQTDLQSIIPGTNTHHHE